MGFDFWQFFKSLEIGHQFGKLFFVVREQYGMDGNDFIEVKVWELGSLASEELLFAEKAFQLLQLSLLAGMQAFLQVVLRK